MSAEEKIQDLTRYFRVLGASDPEDWARSEVEEGIPQYARFVFLHQAWTNVIPEGETSWIDRLIQNSERDPRGPGAGAGPALKRILAAGASREDLAQVVRVMQWQTLSGFMYQLDDPGAVDYPSADLPQVAWTLVQINEHGEILGTLDSLHESVLDTEPSGREMRPSGVGRDG